MSTPLRKKPPATTRPAPPPVAVPPAPKRRVTPEILVGTAAVLLSLAALLVSVVQTRILSAQQRAAVWPRLQVETNHLDDDFRVVLRNAGVGPAVVREVEFAVGGRTYPSAWALLNGEVGQDTVSAGAKYFSGVGAGDVLRPGDELELLSTPRNRVVSDRLDAITSGSTFHARLLYSDIYGACWRLDNEATRTVGRCAESEG